MHCSHLPSVLDTMHSLAEKMLSILNNSLLGLMDMQSVIFSGASGEKVGHAGGSMHYTDWQKHLLLWLLLHECIVALFYMYISTLLDHTCPHI